MEPAQRIYLLSPAKCSGKRAGYLLRPGASFELAQRVQRGDATLGEVFAFMSGLYFRGKLLYARAFGRSATGANSVWVITPGCGLLPADSKMTLARLRSIAAIPVDITHSAYRIPLLRDVKRLAKQLATDDQVVLLGSIATGKYVDLLLDLLGTKLLFPEQFVGRGDMSRGGLLLRQVDAGEPLHYIPVQGAVRHGKRPPRLPSRS